MEKSVSTRRAVAAGLASALLARPVRAQKKNAKPIRLIVPWPPGGSSDVVARLVGQHVAEELGIVLYVDNQGGAGGRIGMRAAARSAPDGQTLVAINNSTNVTLPISDPEVGYDPLKGFSFISTTALVPGVLVVHPSIAATNLQELIALARRDPGRLSYASYGVGSSPHLTAAMFASMAGIDLLHVPYKGGAQAKLDLLAGRVDLLFTDLTVVDDVNQGRLRALITTAPRRVSSLPNLPTAAEGGLQGLDRVGWHGLAFPAGVPSEFVERYNEAVNRALALPSVKSRLVDMGMEAYGSTPAAFEERVATDLARYRSMAAQIDLRDSK